MFIYSNGYRDLKIIVGIGNFYFDFRGGVVGGIIDFNDFNFFGRFICCILIMNLNVLRFNKVFLIYINFFGYCM